MITLKVESIIDETVEEYFDDLKSMYSTNSIVQKLQALKILIIYNNIGYRERKRQQKNETNLKSEQRIERRR